MHRWNPAPNGNGERFELAFEGTSTATGTWTEPTNTTGAWRTLPDTAPDPAELPLGRPEVRSGYLVLNNAADNTR